MHDEYTVHVAVLLLELHIRESGSLKSKRKIIRSLKDRVHAKFNVSFAELAENDKWQRAVCGVSMIGNDQRYLDSCMQEILALVRSNPEAELVNSSLEFL